MKARAVIFALACVSLVGLAGDGAYRHTAHEARPAATLADPGMVVHIDPATGRFVDGAETSGFPAPAATTSGRGLSIEHSTAPGGGIMVNLQGRYQGTFVVVEDETGKPIVRCVSGSPSAHADGEGD